MDPTYIENVVEWAEDVRVEIEKTGVYEVSEKQLDDFIDFYTPWLSEVESFSTERSLADMHNLAALTGVLFIEWETTHPMNFFERVSKRFAQQPPPFGIERIEQFGELMSAEENYYAAPFWLWSCHMFQYDPNDFPLFMRKMLLHQYDRRFAGNTAEWGNDTNCKKKLDTLRLKFKLSTNGSSK